jgi:hypothetical protein
MRNDFKPVHLQEANRKLETALSSVVHSQKLEDEDPVCEEVGVENVSWWKKFLGLFKSNTFDFPEDLHKHK